MIRRTPLTHALITPALALALSLPAQAGLLDKVFETKASVPAVLTPDAKPAEFVTVDKPEKLAGKNQFALTSFTVEFQIQAKDYSSQFGSKVSSSSSMTMEGVSQADMQAITDKVFEDFKAKMAAQGITLTLPAALAASPTWQNIAGMAKGPSYEMSAEKDKVLLLAPTGMNVVSTHPDEETKRLRWGLSGLMAMSSATLPQAEITLAKELGYPVMKAYFVVRFGSAKAVAINKSSQGKATVSGLILGDGQTALSIRTPDASALPSPFETGNAKSDGDSFVRLKNSITTEQNILSADIREQGGANKAIGTALVMLTGAGSHQHDFVAPIDPAVYGTFVTESVGTVSGMFASQLKAASGK